MTADQLNYDLFTYVDNNAVSWNKRGESNTIINTVDGSAAFGTHPAWGRETPRHRTRKIIYRRLDIPDQDGDFLHRRGAGRSRPRH